MYMTACAMAVMITIITKAPAIACMQSSATRVSDGSQGQGQEQMQGRGRGSGRGNSKGLPLPDQVTAALQCRSWLERI